MVINTTFQPVHGAGEFQMAGPHRLFISSVVASLAEDTPDFKKDDNVDRWGF